MRRPFISVVRAQQKSLRTSPVRILILRRVATDFLGSLCQQPRAPSVSISSSSILPSFHVRSVEWRGGGEEGLQFPPFFSPPPLHIIIPQLSLTPFSFISTTPDFFSFALRLSGEEMRRLLLLLLLMQTLFDAFPSPPPYLSIFPHSDPPLGFAGSGAATAVASSKTFGENFYPFADRIREREGGRGRWRRRIQKCFLSLPS